MNDDYDFVPYEDMLEKQHVPMYGLRIVVATDTDGRVFTQWAVEGDPVPDTLLGTLSRVKFLLQVHDLDPSDFAENEFEDEEEPDGAE
jgi:hypothetical protein